MHRPACTEHFHKGDYVVCMQLVHTYSAALQRNDQALFHYGFLQAHDPPKLVAQDMPGGNLYDTPRHSDDDYSARCTLCLPLIAPEGHACPAAQRFLVFGVQ